LEKGFVVGDEVWFASGRLKKPGFCEKPGFWWGRRFVFFNQLYPVTINEGNKNKRALKASRGLKVGRGQSVRISIFMLFPKAYLPNALPLQYLKK